MIWRFRLSAGVAALAITFMTGTAAADAFSAHGSVEQVYVTGLGAERADVAPQPRRRDGGHPAGRRARAALLFRNVTPGSGYRVRPAGGGARVRAR